MKERGIAMMKNDGARIMNTSRIRGKEEKVKGCRETCTQIHVHKCKGLNLFILYWNGSGIDANVVQCQSL